jgi:putative membrane protein
VTSEPRSASEIAAERLTDGEWHRLHPATPLLKGGIMFIAVAGIIISNLRERLIDVFLGVPGDNRDPIEQLYERGLVGWAILVVLVVVLLCVGAFYLSWRMHSFRIGDEAVEMRSGIVFRTHRKARLDRIQGINIVRPVIARIFGAAKLEVSVAGNDANVQLSYLASELADGVRRDILRRASGVRAAETAAAGAGETATAGAPNGGTSADGHGAFTAAPGLINQRVSEFLAPELDPNAAPPASVVRIPPGRLLGSIVLSGATLFLLVAGVALIVGVAMGRYWLLFAFLPGLLGFGSFYVNRFVKSLRYSIAGTADGVRVGFGLLTTSNETLPPGRIHAVEVLQPLLWRPFGWWQVRIDTAGRSRQKGAAGQPNTTMLPVGTVEDTARVLALVLPGFGTALHRELIEAGMMSPGRDGFTGAPRRAAWLRPLSWQRTGYSILDGVILLRSGNVWRRLVIVPLARLQSFSVDQGPVERMLRLASAALHTVEGPVHPRLSVIDRDQAVVLFGSVAEEAIASADRDTSHRWNSARDQLAGENGSQGNAASADSRPASSAPESGE